MPPINGQKIAHKILQSLKPKIALCRPRPKLAVILIGSNPSSHLYVSLKQKRAKEIGIGFQKFLLPAKTKTDHVLNLIDHLNQDKKITAILVQLPLPRHLKTDKIISAIDPAKDADAIHPKHLSILAQGKKTPLLPATLNAILAALKLTKTNLKNKSIAILGKSKIVGLPAYAYFKNKSAQIKIYDSKTKNLAHKTSQADILIVAIGKPHFIRQDYIKPGAIVIDVGVNKIKKRTLGDVDYKNVKNKTAWITPVPGGIGPLTVAFLLKNVYHLYRKNIPPT